LPEDPDFVNLPAVKTTAKKRKRDTLRTWLKSAVTPFRKKSKVQLDRKLSHEEINKLDRIVYEGPIHIIKTKRQMQDAVRKLRCEKLLGFDTETRPAFKKGESYPPALVQLAGRDAVYLFQLRYLDMNDGLTELFSNPRIIKTGVAVGRDILDLRKVTEFEPHGFVDLGTCAKEKGIQHHGLRGLAALLLGGRLSKGSRLTRWDRPQLGREAKLYAATDAWIGRRLYEEMKKHGCL